jgi:pyruvate formate lyase activating enzyme
VKLFKKEEGSNFLRCQLCPHSCLLQRGDRGICGVRLNTGESISLTTYGIISGLALDPIEKKPLYHFYPGKQILSAGSYGCNLKCDFCQNYNISQQVETDGRKRISPRELVSRAHRAEHNIGIAYTYNEPVIWYEYVADCATLAASEGLKNVMVTNGYINRKPLSQLVKVIDAFNVDLKAFNNIFYRSYTGATLNPVLQTIKDIAASGRHLEITTLILPGLNDSEDAMRQEAEWIADNAGSHIPLHISRYFPMYRRNDPPTPEATILRLKELASDSLSYVYTGNMQEGYSVTDTICPGCRFTVIKRSGYRTNFEGLSTDGRCLRCNEMIIRFI